MSSRHSCHVQESSSIIFPKTFVSIICPLIVFKYAQFWLVKLYRNCLNKNISFSQFSFYNIRVSFLWIIAVSLCHKVEMQCRCKNKYCLNEATCWVWKILKWKVILKQNINNSHQYMDSGYHKILDGISLRIHKHWLVNVPAYHNLKKLPYNWLSDKLWYLKHSCVGDTIVYN